MTIAIIEATGMLEKPVTEELIAADFSVRLIVRDIERAKGLFPTASRPITAFTLPKP